MHEARGEEGGVSAVSIWGAPISVYTRADALADGELIDVTGVSTFYVEDRFASVAITRAAHAAFGASDATALHESVSRALVALGVCDDGDRAAFSYAGHAAYALAHLDDDGELCATILLEGED